MVAHNKDMTLECEVCECWFHTNCEKISDQVYKFMAEEGAGDQLHWNFSYCKRGYDELYNYIKRIEIQQVELESKA